MSAHATFGRECKRKRKAPDVKPKGLEVDPLVSHLRRLKTKFMFENKSTLLEHKIKGKGPDVKAPSCRKSERLQNMSTHESVGVKHRIQGKGPDVKAAGIRKSERLRKKHDDQISNELAADEMEEKLDVDKKTCYDGFLGK